MDPLTMTMIGMSAGKLVSSLAGGLLGGGGKAPKVPQYLMDLVLAQYKNQNYTGFLPDKEAYDRSMRSDVDQIMSQLPVSMDAFESNLASRGVSGAGEAAKFQYRDVIAPITSAAAGAVAKGNLGYAEAYQRGSIEEAHMRSQSLNQLIQMELVNMGTATQNWMYDKQGAGEFWNQMGEAAGGLATAGMMKWMKPGGGGTSY